MEKREKRKRPETEGRRERGEGGKGVEGRCSVFLACRPPLSPPSPPPE